MPGSVFFVQQCPTCGRSAQVRVDYLGKGIVCRHCHASFVGKQTPPPANPSESGLGLLDRADELLRAANEYRERQSSKV